MIGELYVHMLPSLFRPGEVRGGLAVMIDVLRASTTIAHAAVAGADRIFPCQEVDEARELADQVRKDAATNSASVGCVSPDVLLGGERDGRLIDGFDLDNSPLAYTAAAVAGKTVVFTTTNGTRALLRARAAERILVGSFVNLHAVIQMLVRDERAVHLVCAGTNGQVSADDCLCAGAIATGVWLGRGRPDWHSDATRITMDFFAARCGNQDGTLETLRFSIGGRNLVAAGFDADIERAAKWDMFDVVPEFDIGNGWIQAAADAEPIEKRWLENRHSEG